VIDDIAEVAGHIWQKGWGERNGGNITVNVTVLSDPSWADMQALTQPVAIGCTLPLLKGAYFYAKGTQKRMRDLAREPMRNGSIIRICDDCAHYEIIADEAVMPTSELPSHLMVQNYLIGSGSGYTATLHTHPVELVAMSHSDEFLDSQHLTRTLWSMIPETLAFAPLGIGVVPYQVPGSVELARATLRLAHNYDVMLWEKHGTFAVGRDIMDAFDQTDVLNKAALIYLRARSMGFMPKGMTEEQMQTVRRVFSLPSSRQA
jgi:rhamnulose-1-phosphate aldolase